MKYVPEYIILKPKLLRGLLDLLDKAQDERNTDRFNDLRILIKMANEVFDSFKTNESDYNTANSNRTEAIQKLNQLKNENEQLKQELAIITTAKELQKTVMKRLLFIDQNLATKISKEELINSFGADILINVTNKSYNPYKKIA